MPEAERRFTVRTAEKTWTYLTLAAAAFSQHVGLLFLFVTVPSTLRSQGASLTRVSLFTLVFIPFALQFLWAPFVERRRRARATGWRSWLLGSQAVLVLGLAVMALIPLQPQNTLALVGVSVALAFAAGTQKIAVGGLAIDTLQGAERAFGNASLGAGSALGSVAASIGLVWLYAGWGWATALLTGAGLTLAAGTIYLRSPSGRADASGTGSAPPSLLRLLRSRMTWKLLGRLALVALPLGLGLGLLQPRLVDAGLDIQTIGLVNGMGQLAMWLIAAPLVTTAVRKGGARRTQIVALLATAGGFMTVCLLTYVWPQDAVPAILSACVALAALIGVSIATYTELMRQAEQGNQAATEFSLYLSIYGLVILGAAGLSGVLGEAAGYAPVLGLAAILALLASFACQRATMAG